MERQVSHRIFDRLLDAVDPESGALVLQFNAQA
jgi:hypothetical protein